MKPSKAKPTERGLTLIESLAAMVVLFAAITAITPPVILAMASRIRTHRAQQALQLAQSEVDRVRLLVEQGRISNDKLPPDVGATKPDPIPAPSGTPTQECKSIDNTQWCFVKLDTDNEWDMAVQRFRTRTQPADPSIPARAFWLGVRVYTRGSVDSGRTLTTQPGSLALSANTTASSSPLAVLYVPIVRSDLTKSSLDEYCQILDPASCP